MAIFKCKMCGGDLEISEGLTVAECEYCGSRQTVPTADNEKKLILFGRANRLRVTCDFDKAAGVYESIVADFPDEAEAYWGLVLCKYGIEYVDDPATGKKIPTCHRSSFDSVMDDSNFEQAMENADEAALRVYREEAKQIEKIRMGILEVSSNEQPYDIFICYKETDTNGDRTVDSLLAQDIYDALRAKGYRVFFSRITLEDKLGQAYEPYIFAALNSAKVMLAVGTCYEHYNAVWVKNEWSRYLKLIAQNKEKYLIPCYKGIDAYDIPKEFAHLQGQDMSKVGAIQDLLRGVEKIIPKQSAQVVQERVVVGGSGNNKIASLLDRGNMALEDGDWAKADSFFEDVLNNDSKNAQAYLGKTLAMERCRTIDAFARKRKDASQSVHGQTYKLKLNEEHINNAVKKYTLSGYVKEQDIRKLYESGTDWSYHSDVAERVNQYKAEEAFWQNHKQLSKAEKFATGAVAENLQTEKKALFAALNERVKKAEQAEKAAISQVEHKYEAFLKTADTKAEELYNDGCARREQRYQQLLTVAKASGDVAELNQTAQSFDYFGEYKDSKNLAEHCRKRAAEEQAKLDAAAEQQRIQKEKRDKARKKKNKRIAIIAGMVGVLTIAAAVVLITIVLPTIKYNDAVELMNEGKYSEARSIFVELDGFGSSKNKLIVLDAVLDGEIAYNSDSDTVTYENPTKYGYTFIGWTGNSITQPVPNLSIPAESYGECEYTANWKPNEYIFTLNANGGTVSQSSISAKYDASYILPTPKREYYTFDGWYDSAELRYADGTWRNAGNVSLTAKWTPISYAITYNLSGGYNSSQNEESFTVETPKISLKDPSRRGYKFLGWYADSSYSKKITEIAAGTHENIDLYAKWEIINYTITYDLNGGTISGTKKTTFTVNDLPLTLPTASKSGLQFINWSKGFYTGEAISKITEVGNITVVASYMDPNLKLKLSSDSSYYIVTDYASSGSASVLDIPAYYNGRPVKEIGESAFRECTSLVTVNIPSTVNKIGDSAFRDCRNLKNVNIPDGVKNIGWSAFESCDALVSITLPNSITSIGNSAFWSCDSLATINLPVGLKSIGEYAFAHCKGLKSVSVPTGVTELDLGVFKGCSGLTNVTLPNTMKKIDSFVFAECSSLTKIIIPSSVTGMAENVFRDCSKLTIYCRATVIPDDWSSGWNGGWDSRPVVWGYTGN